MQKTVYILLSNIPNQGALNFKKFEFNIEHDELDDESDIKEKDKILNFKYYMWWKNNSNS